MEKAEQLRNIISSLLFKNDLHVYELTLIFTLVYNYYLKKINDMLSHCLYLSKRVTVYLKKELVLLFFKTRNKK